MAAGRCAVDAAAAIASAAVVAAATAEAADHGKKARAESACAVAARACRTSASAGPSTAAAPATERVQALLMSGACVRRLAVAQPPRAAPRGPPGASFGGGTWHLHPWHCANASIAHATRGGGRGLRDTRRHGASHVVAADTGRQAVAAHRGGDSHRHDGPANMKEVGVPLRDTAVAHGAHLPRVQGASAASCCCTVSHPDAIVLLLRSGHDRKQCAGPEESAMRRATMQKSYDHVAGMAHRTRATLQAGGVCWTSSHGVPAHVLDGLGGILWTPPRCHM